MRGEVVLGGEADGTATGEQRETSGCGEDEQEGKVEMDVFHGEFWCFVG